jgi:hypothetical protein
MQRFGRDKRLQRSFSLVAGLPMLALPSHAGSHLLHSHSQRPTYKTLNLRARKKNRNLKILENIHRCKVIEISWNWQSFDSRVELRFKIRAGPKVRFNCIYLNGGQGQGRVCIIGTWTAGYYLDFWRTADYYPDFWRTAQHWYNLVLRLI